MSTERVVALNADNSGQGSERVKLHILWTSLWKAANTSHK